MILNYETRLYKQKLCNFVVSAKSLNRFEDVESMDNKMTK